MGGLLSPALPCAESKLEELILRGFMTKQLQATLAAMMVMSTISVRAQLSTTTTTTKPDPTTTKTTVVTKEVPSKSTSATTGSKRRSTRKRGSTRKARVSAESGTERQIRELRELMLAQQAQIDALRQQNVDKDVALAAAGVQAQTANSEAAAAASQAQSLQTLIQQNSTSVQTLSSDVSDLKLANSGLAQSISDTKRDLNEKIESPTTIHYKGVTIMPVAFFALETVYRQHSINSDINTPFNSTPFPGSNEGHISEFNMSGRQSRLGGLIEGNAGDYKLSGYFETDFLSAGATSNANQSNSYTLRQRQIWGKAETKGGFGVVGGQMWSLVTEDGKGTENRTEKLPNTIDSQYMVGFSWARQAALRLQQRLGNPFFGSAVTLAASLENSQYQSFTASGGPTNFFFGGPGTAGGLYNVAGNYANNVAPDVIFKAAMDFPHTHVELGGLARFFRDRVYPLTPSTTVGTVTTYTGKPYNDTKLGGGAFGSVRTATKYVDVGLSGMIGDGTGRYGSSQLADITVHPDGTLEPVRNYHGLFSLEGHPTKKLDVYAYYGAEYAQRTVYRNANGSPEGYGPNNIVDTGCNTYVATSATLGSTGVAGSPATANCGSPTRYIQEGMIGFTYRVVNSPRYGRLQYQFNYNYLSRVSWTGLGSGIYGTPTATPIDPRATNNMIFGGMRYYIP